MIPFIWDEPLHPLRELRLHLGLNVSRPLDLATLGDHKPIVVQTGADDARRWRGRALLGRAARRRRALRAWRGKGAATRLATRPLTPPRARAWRTMRVSTGPMTALTLRVRATAEGGTVVIKIRGYGRRAGARDRGRCRTPYATDQRWRRQCGGAVPC